jgi:hypothetical protein
MASSGMLRRVALVRTDASEELSVSISRVTRIGELGKLTVTNNRHTSQETPFFIVTAVKTSNLTRYEKFTCSLSSRSHCYDPIFVTISLFQFHSCNDSILNIPILSWHLSYSPTIVTKLLLQIHHCHNRTIVMITLL